MIAQTGGGNRADAQRGTSPERVRFAVYGSLRAVPGEHMQLYDWRGIMYRGYRFEPGYTPGGVMSPRVYIWECQAPDHSWQPVRICESVPEAQEWVDSVKPFERGALGLPGSRFERLEFEGAGEVCGGLLQNSIE